MNSSGVCDRAESPGPSFIAGQGRRIQSDVVGETNVGIPAFFTASRNG